MIGRRATAALGWIIAAALAVAANAGLRVRLVPPASAAAGQGDADGQSRAAAPTGTAEVAARVALGGFRALAVTALWVELVDRREAGDYLAIPPLAERIVRLDPRLEAAWSVTAWTLAVDLPGFDDDPEAVWPWLRGGLLHLERGIRANPDSSTLLYEQGLLAFGHVARTPALATRFLADAELNPQGLDPVRFARERWLGAQALPHHPLAVDWAVLRATLAEAGALTAAGRPQPARQRLAEARAALDHARAAHDDAAPAMLARFAEWIAELDGAIEGRE